MTTGEFSKQFDILYNNLASGAAPGVNEYEKSVLLTDAMWDIIKAYYSGQIDKLIPGFEADEKRRRELSELVRPYSTTRDVTLNTELAPKKIHENSVFFEVPVRTLFITFEQSWTLPDPCFDNTPRKLKIQPVKLDYFNEFIDSPFRQPNKEWAWRLDLEPHRNKRVIEIVYLGIPVNSYYMRYVKMPCPIVLTNFEDDEDLSGLNLTVDGVNTVSENELTSLSREILKLAVANAIARYRENSLQNLQNI